MIKCVLLDFGGVLYKINHAATILEFSKLSNNKNFLKEVTPSSAAKEIFAYESGKIDVSEFRNSIRAKFDLNCSDNEFDFAWDKILVEKFDYAATAVSILKQKGYKVYLLSNTNDVHFNKFAPECEDVFSQMDGLFLSYKMNSIKPEAKIYLDAVSSTGFNANECLFADDLQENLDAAQALGIHTQLISDKFTVLDLANKL